MSKLAQATMHNLTCASRYRAGCTTFSGAQLPKRGQYTPRRPGSYDFGQHRLGPHISWSASDVAHTGKRASGSRAAEQQSTTELSPPIVPEEYAGASQQAYLAGFKVIWRDMFLAGQNSKVPSSCRVATLQVSR